MNAFIFYLFYFSCKVISLLPLSLLYRVSDITYFVLYYIIGYRKKIVFNNLKNSFPEKSNSELKKIAKKFYAHFSDVLIETVKLIYFPKEKYCERIKYKNPELLHELFVRNKHAIVVVGHYGNWEWLSGLVPYSPYHTISVYKPLSNPYFDKLLIRLRKKFGTELVPMRKILKTILKYRDENKPSLSCFVGDQSPVWEEVQYWTRFLNQDTAVYLGIEKIAQKTNQVVLFYKISKVKRGYYEVEIVKLFDEAAKTNPFEITESHLKALEQTIREKPEFWLWTHRRWKLTEKKNKYIKLHPNTRLAVNS